MRRPDIDINFREADSSTILGSKERSYSIGYGEHQKTGFLGFGTGWKARERIINNAGQPLTSITLKAPTPAGLAALELTLRTLSNINDDPSLPIEEQLSILRQNIHQLKLRH